MRVEAFGEVHRYAAHREASVSRRFGLLGQDSARYADTEGVARALTRRRLPSGAVLVVVVEVVRGVGSPSGGSGALLLRLRLLLLLGGIVVVDGGSGRVERIDEPRRRGGRAPRRSSLGAGGSGGCRRVEPSGRGRRRVVGRRRVIVRAHSCAHRSVSGGHRQIFASQILGARGSGAVHELGGVREHRALTPAADRSAASGHEPWRGGRRDVLLRRGPRGEGFVQSAFESLDLRLRLVPGVVDARRATHLDAVELLLALGHRAGSWPDAPAVPRSSRLRVVFECVHPRQKTAQEV